jgi:hypothetical protein
MSLYLIHVLSKKSYSKSLRFISLCHMMLLMTLVEQCVYLNRYSSSLQIRAERTQESNIDNESDSCISMGEHN